jgi:hypothetical protein
MVDERRGGRARGKKEVSVRILMTGLAAAVAVAAQGQRIVATVFGRGAGDDPLTIEMRAVQP